MSLIYGDVNRFPVNVNVFNGAQFITDVLGGRLVEFSQDVLLRIAVTGAIITCSQDVRAKVNDISIPITQIVTTHSSTLATRTWDVVITIDGIQINASNIIEDVVIVKASNQSTTCKFKLKSTDPLTLISQIDGKSITIDYISTTSGNNRLFTGVVDYPEIDIINKWVTVSATNRRDELITQKIKPILPTLGRYALSVQGEITSDAQELEYRLQTVAGDLDFDSYNNPNVNSWYAKATPDFTLTNYDVYYREPTLTWQNRTSVVNEITINLSYQYTRLYHYQRPFSWDMDATQAALAATGTNDSMPVSFCTAGMVQSAIESAGWKENDTLTYVDQYPATIGARYGFLGPVYNPLNDKVSFTYTGGGLLGGFFTVQRPTTLDQIRILSADWEGSTRFSQYIQENYTLTVKSTQSQTQYGEVSGFYNINIQDDFDAGEWENYKAVTPAPPNAVTSNNSYWANQDEGQAELKNALLTAIDKAKTEILAGHRDTIVECEVPLMPSLELRHTIELDTSYISCKGKVVGITHSLGLIEKKGHTTQIRLALFRSLGSASTTATIEPARPSDVPFIPSSAVVLGNHFGLDLETTPGSDSWSGYVGNTTPPTPPFNISKFDQNDINTYPKHPQKTSYKEAFIVKTPAIPDDLRKLRKLEQTTATYEIAIPNDDLDI